MATLFIDHFLRNLQPAEVTAITNYIKKNVNNAEESNTLDVFEKLVAGKPVPYKNQKALNKIKSRILEKSLDAMMMDERYIADNFCEFDQVHFRLKKLMSQCKLIYRVMTESKVDLLKHLINQIISDAKKYELYIVLMEALMFKKYFVVIRSDRSALEIINKEIDFYDYCNKAMYEAIDNYYRLVAELETIKTLSEKEYNKWLNETIKQMDDDFQKTKSQQINYYLHIFRSAFYELKKDYPKSIEQYRSLIYLMKKHPCIYKTDRLAFAFENLCQYSIFSYKYKDAEKYILSAKPYLIKNSLNNIIRIELEFRVYFYSKQYTKAKKCINNIFDCHTINIGEFRKAKYTYFNIYTHFAQEQFKEALALLIIPLEVEKDKSSWNLGLRILTIMTYIELNRIIDASRSLDALRKYIERNKLADKISERNKLIIKTLREMEKNMFEYDPKNITISQLIKQLAIKNAKTSWEHFSPELIPFHEWVTKLS